MQYQDASVMSFLMLTEKNIIFVNIYHFYDTNKIDKQKL